VHIREEIPNVLLAQRLAIGGHFVAAEADDVAHSIIVGRQSAERKIFVLEDSLETRAFLAALGVRLVAAVAVGVVDLAAGRLLRIEAKFRVRLAALDVASRDHNERQQHKQRPEEDSGETILQNLRHRTIIS